MRFWCVRVLSDWTWTWRPYFGVWALVAVFSVIYARSWRRHLRVTGRSLTRPDRRHIVRFAAAMVVLLLA